MEHKIESLEHKIESLNEEVEQAKGKQKEGFNYIIHVREFKVSFICAAEKKIEKNQDQNFFIVDEWVIMSTCVCAYTNLKNMSRHKKKCIFKKNDKFIFKNTDDSFQKSCVCGYTPTSNMIGNLSRHKKTCTKFLIKKFYFFFSKMILPA